MLGLIKKSAYVIYECPLRDTESGQFMDCCAPANKDHVDCCPIEVPEGDLFFGVDNRPDCLPFLRSKLFEHQG